MTVPVWLGYFMLIAFSMALIGLGLILISNVGSFIVNVVLPTWWSNRQHFKIKNMSKEQLEDYIYAIRYDWTEENMRREQEKNDKSTKN